MSNFLVRILSTFFYVGFFPVAPGTLASFVGALIYISVFNNMIFYAVTTILVTVIGFLVSGRMERLEGSKDPGCVVIDEVSGILIALCFLPLRPAVLITAFFLFRAFDMFKIYPANKLEMKGGSYGIMMDDIVAGIYTNITMQISIRLVNLF